jgi:hypothetical protein
VKKAQRTGEITGKISASPNPLSFGQSCVVISWETNDHEAVHRFQSPEEKAVSEMRSGQPRSLIADSG